MPELVLFCLLLFGCPLRGSRRRTWTRETVQFGSEWRGRDKAHVGRMSGFKSGCLSSCCECCTGAGDVHQSSRRGERAGRGLAPYLILTRTGSREATAQVLLDQSGHSLPVFRASGVEPESASESFPFPHLQALVCANSPRSLLLLSTLLRAAIRAWRALALPLRGSHSTTGTRSRPCRRANSTRSTASNKSQRNLNSRATYVRRPCPRPACAVDPVILPRAAQDRGEPSRNSARDTVVQESLAVHSSTGRTRSQRGRRR